MKKLYVIATVAAMLIGATLLLERVPTVAAAQSGIKNVVLVHGAFADGSGWEAKRSLRQLCQRRHHCCWRRT